MFVPTNEYSYPLEVAKRTRETTGARRRGYQVGSGRYVITCAQNNSTVHDQFFQNLKSLGGQIIVLPIRYLNPTNSLMDDKDIWWSPKLAEYICNQRVMLSEYIEVRGDIMIQATSLLPCNGLSVTSRGRSQVFGHPVRHHIPVPCPTGEIPPYLHTTGSCTNPCYSQTKTGSRAAEHYVLGALLVDVHEDGYYHARQINATHDGSFYDLDCFYSEGEVSSGHAIESILLGDWHSGSTDPDVIRTLPEIYAKLNPEYTFIGDAIDFHSQSHHRSPLDKMLGTKQSVRDEVNQLARELKTLFQGKIVIVPSNHNDHLTKWMQTHDPRVNQDPDPGFFYQLMAYWCEAPTVEPLRLALELVGCDTDKFIWLNRQCSFVLNGIDYSQHGDVGIGGARGSTSAFTKVNRKITKGHSHSAEWIQNTVSCGTSATLKPDYKKGYGTWSNSHVIAYKNGKRAILTMINGRLW